MCGALAFCSPVFVTVPGQWNLLPGAAVCIIDPLVEGGWAHPRDYLRYQWSCTSQTSQQAANATICIAFIYPDLRLRWCPSFVSTGDSEDGLEATVEANYIGKSLKYPGFSASFVCLCSFGMKTCVLQINMQAALLTWWVALVTMGLLSCNALC